MFAEFYKNRINQDILADLKINRIIIERTKQQAKRYDEIRAEDVGLTDFQLDDFNKIYLSFSSTLDDYVNKLEANTEIFRNAGLVIYRYNLLATVLNKVKFNFLPKLEKDKLVNQLEDLEPKLEELYRYANINDFTDLKTIGEIVNNFKKKTFQQVKVGDVRLKEIQQIGENRESDLDYIIQYLSKLNEYEKSLLTKTELLNLERLSKKAQQSKRDLQKGKGNDQLIEQLIKDFYKVYQKVNNKLQKIILREQLPEKPVKKEEPIMTPQTQQSTQPISTIGDPSGLYPQFTFTSENFPELRGEDEYGLFGDDPETFMTKGEPSPDDLYYTLKMTPQAQIEEDYKSPNAKGKVKGLSASAFEQKYGVKKTIAGKFLDSYYKK